jgi:tetratricopeptide (TPR) repeat protein
MAMPRLPRSAPLAFALVLAPLAVALTAHAEDSKPAASVASAPPATAKPAPTSASPSASGTDATGTHQDAKPLSPELDTFAKGDAAMLAKDYETAMRAYQEAISKAPETPLPYYRLAEAQKLKGDLQDAERTYNTALRFVGNDGTLKAKVLFCLADLSERQKAYDQAIERWFAYEVFAKSAVKAKVHPASAGQRKKRVQDWKQNAADSAEVKARIAKRLEVAEETTRKNAAKK